MRRNPATRAMGYAIVFIVVGALTPAIVGLLVGRGQVGSSGGTFISIAGVLIGVGGLYLLVLELVRINRRP